MVARTPLAVRGYGFGALEKVRVDAASGKVEVVRTVRAGARGAFVVVFPGLRLDGRTDLTVTAVGGRGHRASFTIRHTDGDVSTA